MNGPLMVTVSGVRGIIGSSLLPSVISKYVTAFALLQHGRKIIVGRDSRVSGPWIEKLTQGILMAQGYECVDVGVVPTPTVQFMVTEEKADGGIIITSSHNPVEWNGLKFVGSDGLFLSPEKCAELFSLADSGPFVFPSYHSMGKVTSLATASQRHIEAIVALPYVNVASIQARSFKIVLDSVNGAGGPIMHSLLTHLGADVVGMNLDPSGIFAHKPEPVPANLGSLCDAVKANGADLGIAVDPDVDRCVLINEHGEPLGEEYTLAIVVDFLLKHVGKRGPVCKNLSTSRAIDDIARSYGCPVFNTPVGEIHVAKKMVEVNAIIGGEGNGGVMLPDIHIGRDAPIAAVLVLQALVAHGGSISQLKAGLPQYEIVKLTAPIEGIDPDAVVQHFQQIWEGRASLTSTDGLRIDTPDWWVHLRKSNTEPIIRVIGEGGGFAQSMERCQQFLTDIVQFSQQYKNK
eukprot:TRINITY_DN1643_c0_g1_i1.p1 TRINITY_DN1643_c0_g1~~TRINITY_DN1643_c0_g1_i1.p1  ORF type:complete len:461 (+),score=70.14 TRINITY_DN1643_c0_g1_i1:56-1438(+)